MKCIQISDTQFKAQDLYNAWAKNKPLTKDVIVHTHITPWQSLSKPIATLDIIIFYDEKLHPDW